MSDIASTLAQGVTYAPPTALDPTLLLNSAGASSTSKDGTASNSVSSARDAAPSPAETLRNQAMQTLLQAKQASEAANSQPVPQAQPVRYSPLETAIAAAVGGALNAASPFTAEGSKGLQAYMQAKQGADEQQYQNDVARHTQAIQAAQQGYKMALDQANPMLDEAKGMDQTAAANQRQQNQIDAQARMQREATTSREHEDELQRIHEGFMKDTQASLDTKLQQGKILQQKFVDVLAQTGSGRAFLAAQTGTALGKSPAEIVQMARIAALATPKEAADHAKAHLQREQLQIQPINPLPTDGTVTLPPAGP